MEGKIVIMTTLLLSFVLGQIQDEAKRICCKTTTANGCFNMCRMAPWACAEKCGCEFIPNDEVCVVDNHDILKNTGQVQVEAKRICCQTTTANSCFNMCRMAPWACAERCECKFIPDDEVCVVDNQNILKNTGDDAFNEYCKLGCVSSVCGAMTTLQNSDASEVVNGAVEKCTKACSAFCTKGSIAAVKVEIA